MYDTTTRSDYFFLSFCLSSSVVVFFLLFFLPLYLLLFAVLSISSTANNHNKCTHNDESFCCYIWCVGAGVALAHRARNRDGFWFVLNAVWYKIVHDRKCALTVSHTFIGRHSLSAWPYVFSIFVDFLRQHTTVHHKIAWSQINV